MNENNSEVSEEFLAELVSKCLYRETHYGSGIPRKLEDEIYNVANHELPSGLRVYGVRTAKNPRFYRDVVIAGEELDHLGEWEEPCYGADAMILKPCIILAHTTSQDRPDTVICQVGYHKGYDFYTVSNRKNIDGTGGIKYSHEIGYYNRQAELDSEEQVRNTGVTDIIGETIRAIQEFKKIPDNLKKMFIDQLESFKAKIEVEKGMQAIPVTQIVMERFIQDLEKKDTIVFEGDEESEVLGELADRIYVIDDKEYRVSCTLNDRKKLIPELSDGKLSDETYMKISISSKNRSGKYDEDRCRMQIYYGEEGERIYCKDWLDHNKCKKYKITSNGAFMTSNERVFHIVAPDESEVQLNPRELELATQDTVKPDQIRRVYNRLRDIVKYQVVDGIEIVKDKYGYIQEKVGTEQARLTGDDFERKVPENRVAEGVVSYSKNGYIQDFEDEEVGDSK